MNMTITGADIVRALRRREELRQRPWDEEETTEEETEEQVPITSVPQRVIPMSDDEAAEMDFLLTMTGAFW